MTSDQLVRRVFFGLTLLFIIFIVYASWTPGDGPTGQRAEFQRLEDDVFGHHDLRDIATNVLLYMPLGFFLAMAVAGRRPRLLSPWILGGLAVSLTMEAGQMYIGRTPDVLDLITNSVGYVLGYGLVVVGVRAYGLDPRLILGVGTDDGVDARTQTIAAARFIYISVYVLVALLPFDVSVSLERIYAQLLPDDTGKIRIILDPVYHLDRWDESGIKLTIELLGLVPIAVLTALLGGIKGRISLMGAVFTTVMVAFACELCQVFILSRTTDIILLPLAVVAGASGWGVVKGWFNLQHVDATAAADKQQAGWRSLAVAIVIYMFVILFFAWSPFRFETDPVAVATKILNESNLVPFKEHFAVRSLGSAIDIVKEAGLFVPLGVLVAFLLMEVRPAASRTQVVLIAATACGAFAVFTELAQSVSIGRYIDITDVFLAAGGGLAGVVMLGLFRSGAVIKSVKGVKSADSGDEPRRRRRRRSKGVRRYW